MKKGTMSLTFSVLTSLALVSNPASAVLMMCNDGLERQGSLEVTYSNRCSSGLEAAGYGWNYRYCLINETGHSLTPGYYQSCIRFSGSGAGNGYVTVFSAVDARFR